MRLDKYLPRKVLRYFWEVFAVPLVYPRPRHSHQGAEILFATPNGAAVAAGGGGAPDALRGSLSFYFPWDALPTTAQSLDMWVYKTGDTVDPTYVSGPVNSLAGRTSIIVGAADSQSQVELAIQTQIATWLAHLNLYNKWIALGGQITFYDTVTPHQPMFVAPKGVQVSFLIGATDAMLPMLVADNVNPAIMRPYFPAGFHPGPWQIEGTTFDGYGVPRGAE